MAQKKTKAKNTKKTETTKKTESTKKTVAASPPADSPAFVFLASARAAVSGLDDFSPPTLTRRGSNFVTEKYFSMILQRISQDADLKQATGIEPATFRSNLAFISSLSSFPAACQALGNDVAVYLDAMLLSMSDQARSATSLLAWKAKTSKDTNAAKTVAQLRALPKGRGVTIPKKKKRASPGSATATDARPSAKDAPPSSAAASASRATAPGSTSVDAASTPAPPTT